MRSRMNKKNIIEIADIFKNVIKNFEKLSIEQYKTANAIINCRTRFLGGHILQCDKCDNKEQSYNSCRNRHCPRCMALRRGKWLEQKTKEILPVKYFHIVFTLPDNLNPLIYVNKKRLYNLLFEKVKETLTEAAENPKNLGAKTGFTAILHTWGQTLAYHPHIHCVVPSGGINPEQNKWISSRKNFFISVKKLSKLFQGKFLYSLKKLYKENALEFHGEAKKIEKTEDFQKLINQLYKKKWVVYAKKPFVGPKQVFKYLAKYIHRVAISSRRIISYSENVVKFSYKDYRDNKTKEMKLDEKEFVRRFLMHVLPDNFMKIRSYGIFANKNKKKLIKLSRQLIGAEIKNENDVNLVKSEIDDSYLTEKSDSRTCPKCKTGKMSVVEVLIPMYASINSS